MKSEHRRCTHDWTLELIALILWFHFHFPPAERDKHRFIFVAGNGESVYHITEARKLIPDGFMIEITRYFNPHPELYKPEFTLKETTVASSVAKDSNDTDRLPQNKTSVSYPSAAGVSTNDVASFTDGSSFTGSFNKDKPWFSYPSISQSSRPKSRTRRRDKVTMLFSSCFTGSGKTC